LNRVEGGESFRGGRLEEMAVRAGKGDLQPFLAQEQGACEVESVGASERMTVAESGYESEDLGADRNLRERLPILCKAKPELLKLRGEKESFPSTASKSSMELGEREV
jgi:hypothetical protein